MLGALAKFGMGMVHGDGNTRQCMATSVVAYKQAFGFDAPPYTYADFEESDVIVLVGLEPVHRPPDPVGARLPQPARPRDRRRRPAAHRDGDGRHPAPAPCAPKSDLALLYGLGAPADRAGLGRPRRSSTPTPPASRTSPRTSPRSRPSGSRPRPACRVDAARAARRRRSHAGERVSFWWTMGVNQSHEGVRTAQAIIDLALMTGNIGRPGTGANSITGQCNAMGSRLFSNTTNLLGGRDFADAGAPGRRSPAILGIDAARIPTDRSLAYDQIIEGIRRGHDQGPVGHRHQPGPLLDQPDSTSTTCSAGSTSWWCRTCTPRPRRPSWPTSCCPPPAGARRRARSSTPSGASA